MLDRQEFKAVGLSSLTDYQDPKNMLGIWNMFCVEEQRLRVALLHEQD